MLERTLVTLAVSLFGISQAFAHTEGITVYSTLPGGGSLAVTGVDDEPIEAELIFCSNGECLYETGEVAIIVPDEDDDHEGLYTLASDTALRIEVVSIDVGAAVRVAGAKLDQAGESAALGTTPELHTHSTWEIEAPEREVGEWTVVFRFIALHDYGPSAVVTFVVSNDEGSTSTSTNTSTTTSTSSTSSTTTTTHGGATCGNAVIEGPEVCDAGAEPWSAGRACNDSCEWLACGDPDDDGSSLATDALYALTAAVGVAPCDDCICNVDASTAPRISGGDALRILRDAIGLEPGPLACAPCGS